MASRVSLLSLFPLSLSAYAQTALTGAIQFSTNSTGAAYGGLLWNTLGGDNYYDLWLAQNGDATLPVNGPSDNLAGIDIPLKEGSSYEFHTFGQPGPGIVTGFDGLNLFFDGESSTPGISVFGALNSAAFLPDHSSTLTLQGVSATGSGSTAYITGSVAVALTGYEWNAPATPPGDLCQSFSFTQGDGPDYSGSFTLHVFPLATLGVAQPNGPPGTTLYVTGGGFTPLEPFKIYAGQVGSILLFTGIAGNDGTFAEAVREPQHPEGPMGLFALGETSGKLGVAPFSVTPGMAATPSTVAPGATTAVQGVGFGARETVSIYLDEPRELIGTATADTLGGFAGSGALTVTIPANALSGSNALIGVGQSTTALGIGSIFIQ